VAGNVPISIEQAAAAQRRRAIKPRPLKKPDSNNDLFIMWLGEFVEALLLAQAPVMGQD